MGDRIDADNHIQPGQVFASKNGKYQLIFQNDSNFVLYKKDDGSSQQPIWASSTYDGDNSASGKYVVLQSDGNLVIYAGDGHPLWASNTEKYDGLSKPYIMVQDDGNVVLYDEGRDGAVWATNTYQGE